MLSALINVDRRYRQSDTSLGRVMTQAAMDRDKKPPIVRKPDVLRKFNAESLLMIERGLLGDLPQKLKPQPFISRARPDNLEIAKPSGLLSSCLPTLPAPDSPSPVSEKIRFELSDDESVSPLKKSFSFRDKFSRISIFGKDKDKDKKWKTIDEDERDVKLGSDLKRSSRVEHDLKSQKRFWFFRQKDIDTQKQHTPIYQRSKSFEFLPRAIEEEENKATQKLNRQSSAFEESMGDAWTSNESLEYISNVYYDKEDGVFLKSIREFPSESSSMTNNNSSISTATSVSSANVENIFKSASVQNLLDEFNKAVDLFSENYLSDCEPYTKSTKKIPVKEKRKSSSFSNIPSPKVLHVTKVNEISEDFKKELSRALSVKRSAPPVPGRPRRGSVTDWFVLEDHASEVKSVGETNKYRRGQKKAINRVRRMSSTKYVSYFDLIQLYLDYFYFVF